MEERDFIYYLRYYDPVISLNDKANLFLARVFVNNIKQVFRYFHWL